MSNSFNSLEKHIANLLSKFPQFKSSIKKFYSSINYFFHKKDYSFKTELKIEKIISDEKNESFFGYYDKSPLSSDGKYIIFHEIEEISSHLPPDPGKPVRIMLYNTEKPDYKYISSTTAYNWQQGSKLQWFNSHKFVFNDFKDGKYISRIYDILNDSYRTIDFPVYDCYKDEFALSLNFSRLNELDTHYGYKNSASADLMDVKNDGIYHIDLKSGIVKLLFSIDQVIELHPKNSMNNALHCFNHIMISPDGQNIIFIHRWYQVGKRYDSLILSNALGTKIRVLADNGMVSHCCWYDNNNVVGYLNDNSYGNTFYKINIQNSGIELLSEKLKNFGDGHPSFFDTRMLFDSYPDRSRMQHLHVYDIAKNEVTEFGEFLSPLKFFRETRCDLHPRWSSGGNNVFFDSTHNGKRHLYFSNNTKLQLK